MLSFFAVQFLNAVGDLLDLIPMLFPSSKEDWHSLNKADARKYQWEMGHCSALIKVRSVQWQVSSEDILNSNTHPRGNPSRRMELAWKLNSPFSHRAYPLRVVDGRMSK